MTWRVLYTAVWGLYESLPLANRSYEATFKIWDYRYNLQWGTGKVTTGPIRRPGSLNSSGWSNTSSTEMVVNSASANVVAA